ncbi:DUF4230 domain-containing protein [Croceiramulus getboli]|nr:DUF4230 domain-containing protein [Flavobacteriaceae bacterium YJPT1-3]
MRKILLGAVLATVILLGVNYCSDRQESKVEAASQLIQQQIKNVGKLIVTEGHFAEVFTYKDSKTKLGLDFLRADKQALIVVNARVDIAYDLNQLQTEIDEEAKTVTITYLPEPEIKISPDIEYYDIQQDYLNQFSAEDYNTIKAQVNQLVNDRIALSNLKENARDRILAELQKLYIVTQSMGWSLQFQGMDNPLNSNTIPFKN